ncbi:hypothetical protein ACIQXD_31145 [Streptomyces uncialis]|uniref:hypothetical protein n=1 Tax=Streptomyces uncialis TaxID=1048205 RepID=UPI00380CABFF
MRVAGVPSCDPRESRGLRPGLEALAQLRSSTGEHDRAFVDARVAEIRALLDDESLADAAVEVARVGTVDGYRV